LRRLSCRTYRASRSCEINRKKPATTSCVGLSESASLSGPPSRRKNSGVGRPSAQPSVSLSDSVRTPQPCLSEVPAHKGRGVRCRRDMVPYASHPRGRRSKQDEAAGRSRAKAWPSPRRASATTENKVLRRLSCRALRVCDRRRKASHDFKRRTLQRVINFWSTITPAELARLEAEGEALRLIVKLGPDSPALQIEGSGPQGARRPVP
jgi:hypothetical protein